MDTLVESIRNYFNLRYASPSQIPKRCPTKSRQNPTGRIPERPSFGVWTSAPRPIKKRTGWENFRWNVRTWGGKRIESWNKKTLNLDLFCWICLRLFHPIDPFIFGHLSGFQSIYVKSYSLDLFCWCFADSIPWWSSPIFHHHLVEYVFPMTKQANRRRINCWYLSLKGLGLFQVSRLVFFD